MELEVATVVAASETGVAMMVIYANKWYLNLAKSCKLATGCMTLSQCNTNKFLSVSGELNEP